MTTVWNGAAFVEVPAAEPGENWAEAGVSQEDIDAIINGAPAALDTLNELAAALGDDADYAASIATALAGKVALPAVGPTSADQLLGLSDDDPLTTAWVDPPEGGGGGGNSVFGDGSDGIVTFNGSSTILGIAPSSNRYTLSRDLYVDQMTVNNGVTIATNGFAIFCKTSCTVNSGGIIRARGSGTPDAIITIGGSSHSPQRYSAGSTGVSGGVNAGTNGSAISASVGGGGGAGGTGSAGAGGTGGAATAPTAAQGGIPRSLSPPIYGGMIASTSKIAGGGAGGSGGGNGTNAGGGGGAGGGILLLAAKDIVNNGSISANGGNGAPIFDSNCGGGGGGGGGAVLLVYNTFTGNAATAAGGTGGAGAGTGTAGTSGSAGNVIALANA